MVNEAYLLESQHERRIKNRKIYREGKNAIRSAASKGVVDVVAWGEHELELIASQRGTATSKWHPLKMRDILRRVIKTTCPNCGTAIGHVYFYEGRRIIGEEEARSLIKKYLERHPEYA